METMVDILGKEELMTLKEKRDIRRLVECHMGVLGLPKQESENLAINSLMKVTSFFVNSLMKVTPLAVNLLTKMTPLAANSLMKMTLLVVARYH